MADRNVKVILSADVAAYKAAFEQASESTKKAREEADKVAAKKQAFQDLGQGLLVVGGAMTAMAVTVAKAGIEYNVLQQTSRAALKTLLGGAEAANEQMDKLNEFARTSPFAKTTFIQAQQQMLAFGIETRKVIPYLDALQDAVAAAGGSNQQLGELAFIMAQISSAGKITAQDLLQFGQRGVNAAELIGSQMGKTGAQIRDEITKGSLGADDALDALAKGMKEKFNGAAANVKLTFGGALDRVKAAFRDLAADLAKPLVDPNGGGMLVDAFNWAADMMRAFQKLPEPIKNVSGALFGVVGVVALLGAAVLLVTPKIMSMYASFKILQAEAVNAVGKLGGVAGILGGPWAIALTAATIGLSVFFQKQAEAAQRAEAFAGSLDTVTGALTDQTRELAKSELSKRSNVLWWQDDSTFDLARKFKVNLQDVTDAALGNEGAMKRVNAQIDSHLAGINGDEKTMRGWNDTARVLRDRINESSGALKAGKDIAKQKSEADGKAADSTDKHAEATKDATAAFEEEQKAASDLKKQLDNLLDTINTMNGLNQSVEATNARYQASLAGISEEVQKQKDAFENANGTLDGFSLSLDLNTVAGSANRNMLSDVAKAAIDSADAQFRVDAATVGTERATANYSATLAAQKQAFIDSATAAGFNADEVKALADRVFQMPEKKYLDVLARTDGARNALDKLISDYDNMRVNIVADLSNVNSIISNLTKNANGGIYHGGVKAFANSGFEPGIYPYVPGGIHKFAEEYSEAYISMDPARRKRSEQVWVETGRQFGMLAPAGSSAPSLSLDGMAISGRLEIGGDGIGRLVDAKITAYDTSLSRDVGRRRS